MITEQEKLTDQEHDYYQACVKVFNLMSGTELESSVSDLRDQTIERLGKMKDIVEIHMEQGKLQILNKILNYKNTTAREISRLEELMEKDETTG